MEGRIKYANSKGFGFIETEKQIDFYFHHTQFKGDWKAMLGKFVKGEQIIVKFDLDMSAEEPRALDVNVIDRLTTDKKEN